MHWQRGLHRFRLVATALLLLGVLMYLSARLTSIFGYAPDPGFVGFFNLLIHLGLVLILIGLLLWPAYWILLGFRTDNAAAAPSSTTPGRAHFDR